MNVTDGIKILIEQMNIITGPSEKRDTVFSKSYARTEENAFGFGYLPFLTKPDTDETGSVAPRIVTRHWCRGTLTE